MKWYTHILFPIVLLKLLGFDIFLIILGALAALLPDVDVSNSPIGRLLPQLSRRIGRRYAHRSITHSLPILSLITVAGSTLGFEASLALAIGYLSHLLLDMLNPTGVPLLYPKPSQFVLLGGSVSVGEVGEKALCVFLVAALTVLICFDILGTDPASFLGTLITSDSWVAQWEALGQDSIVQAKVYGFWGYSKSYVEITGNVTYGEGSMIYVESDDSIYSVSNREGSSIIASKVELTPLEIWTKTTILKSKDYSNYEDFLGSINNAFLISGRIHFLNQITSEQKFDIEQVQMQRPESHAPVKVIDSNTIEFRQTPLSFLEKISCCIPDGELKAGTMTVTVIG